MKEPALRIWALDILRGFAMFLVLVQHPYLLTDQSLVPPGLNFLIWNSTAMAAIAFVMISGAVYSCSLFMRPEWQPTYGRYVKRAFFLLLVAHPLIGIAKYPYSAMEGDSLFWHWPDFFSGLFGLGYITDTIALCILVSPLIILKIDRFWRGILVVVLLSVSPFVVSYVQVDNSWLTITKEFFFGKWGEPKSFWYPFLPWLAVFLSGSFIGERLAELRHGNLQLDEMVRSLGKTGLVLLCCSLFFIFFYKFLKLFAGGELSTVFYRTIYPTRMTGLFPAYMAFLFWGTVLLTSNINVSGHYNRIFWWLSIFGRTSLFTYIIQFIVVESIPATLGYKGVLDATGYFFLFIIGTSCTWFSAYSYGRLRGWFSATDYSRHVQLVRQLSVEKI